MEVIFSLKQPLILDKQGLGFVIPKSFVKTFFYLFYDGVKTALAENYLIASQQLTAGIGLSATLNRLSG